MKHTEYNSKKKALIEFSKQFKRTNDKPAAREAINNYTDSLLKELSSCVSTKRYSQYSNWLSNVASDQHPN
jgi:hypothetical protein